MGSSSNDDDPWWYSNRQRKVALDDNEISEFVRRLGRDLAPAAEFAVVVASERAVREANRRFRGKSGSTDVLSFPDEDEGRLGDILVCAGRAEAQANEYGHSAEAEVKTLILHGLLHLLGFDHETDAGDMRRREARLRLKYGLETGLIERVQQPC